MSPHYNRHATGSESVLARRELGAGAEDDAMDEAAQALRQAEVEAVQPEVSSIDPSQLERMSIDELRAVAGALDVPERGSIIERDELIAAIRRQS